MTSSYAAESDIFIPVDDALNSDDWPIFELADAVVYNARDRRRLPTSLLTASVLKPLTVTGRLRPPTEDQSHRYVRQNAKKSILLQVTDIRLFSYGSYEDGSVALWAGGKAGWYELQPASEYQRIFDDMIEAIKILYFVADSYKERPGKGKTTGVGPSLSPQGLFERYAKKKMRKGSSAADAAELVYKHREFLLASMIAGKEDMSWGRNPLYTHLKGRFSQDWEAQRERLLGPAVQRTAQSKPTQHARQPSVDSTSTSSSLKRKRGRPPKAVPSDAEFLDSGSAAGVVAREMAVEEARPPARSRTQPASQTSLRSSRRQQTESQPDTPRQVPEVAESDESEDDMPQARKGKSALRLKLNKPSKGPPKSSRPPVEEADESGEPPPRSSPVQKGQRNPTEDVDEGISMPTSPSSTSEAVERNAEDDAVAGAQTSELAYRNNHLPDPVQEDTWICALAGCTHKVYAASRPASQELIKQHYKLHAFDDDPRVQLIKKIQAPSLPVANLLERTKLQARLELEGFPGSRVAGSRFPEPVRQNF